MRKDEDQLDERLSEWPDGEDASLLKANDELMCARNKAIDLLAEIEDILLHQNPIIAAEWQVTVGVWENRLLEVQIAARRAKRRANLLQACVNAEERIDEGRLVEIELQLDEEFKQWTEQLEQATDAYQEAVATQMATIRINGETADAVKRVFRTLAKRLHPDLHPNLDKSARNMFELAELAYRQGDIRILQSLEISTRGMEEASQFCETVIEAQAELALVEAQIAGLEEKRANLKSEKPYCLRALLRDKAGLEEHIAKIKNEIATCMEAEEGYRARCDELVG